MNNRFVLVLIAIAAGFFGLLFLNKKDATAPTQTNVEPTNHIQGGQDAKVTLLEYGDFECPACGAYYPVLKQVKAKYGDKLKFQFRNFPLTQLHPNAMRAHRAAEAAHKQGKFFEMHDKLYEGQAEWRTQSTTSPDPIFEGYASVLGLNLDQFKADMNTSEINDIIQADIKAGQDLKLTATPSFFLNGQQLEDPPRDLDGFSKLIDEQL